MKKSPFRHNVGKSRIIFEDGHPYFKANDDARALQLSAVKNYGMKPVKEIYGNPEKLSGYKREIRTEEDYREYWRILESHYGKEGEGFTLVDRKNNISALFDSSLKEKLFQRRHGNARGRAAVHGGLGAAGQDAQLVPRQPKKLVGAHLLSEEEGEDGFEKGCALIRANLGIDPEAGGYEEWAARYAEALWLEKFRNRNLARTLAGLFGGGAKG